MTSHVETRGPELLVVNVVFWSLAFITCLLRAYVRCFIVKAFRIDDWLMVLATIFFTTYATFSTVGVTFGTGRHHDDLTMDQIYTAMMCWWFCYLFYCLAMISCKLSIGYFLLRVTTNKLQRWTIYIAMFSTALSGAIFFFVTVFQCNPVSFFWNKDQEGRCVSPDIIIALAALYSVFAVISDLVFAVLPGIIVWNLQLHKKTKYSLIPLLAMGCVASAAVIARFPYLAYFRKPDFLWNTLDIAIWSTIEQGLAITASSLATLRPLLKLAGFRMGFTSKPLSVGPSGYMSSPRTPGPGTGNGFGRGDAYTLSSVSRPGAAESRGKDFESAFPGESGIGIKKEIKWEVEISQEARSESQEELRSPYTWKNKPTSHWDA
ncbi:integral membrane protein PTH11 [Fusarium heterosporum]|uniref:Integral membrane protein PTH11 n=1 Tax=Fusarium heterosporum TaxID=42747 RepID=A0A8H5T7S7_FUSHE|nr:integral membrane protein PTH11 [Fusarium heterosporum]